MVGEGFLISFIDLKLEFNYHMPLKCSANVVGLSFSALVYGFSFWLFGKKGWIVKLKVQSRKFFFFFGCCIRKDKFEIHDIIIEMLELWGVYEFSSYFCLYFMQSAALQLMKLSKQAWCLGLLNCLEGMKWFNCK